MRATFWKRPLAIFTSISTSETIKTMRVGANQKGYVLSRQSSFRPSRVSEVDVGGTSIAESLDSPVDS